MFFSERARAEHPGPGLVARVLHGRREPKVDDLQRRAAGQGRVEEVRRLHVEVDDAGAWAAQA